ncbi:MAG: zinc-binding alcohol dehydrogenase family protein [Nitrospira sp.]|jgi:zinc-binding alcohol dehydrogenase family protein|nr:zinc-binding alcohol dehydrogenase family protein [Nitrospira sp.]
MKALGYTQAHTLDAFNLQLTELPDPIPTGRDLLVEVKAIGLNPIDYKIRSRRSGTDGQPVILGWDAAGIVRASGNEATHFKVGDEVFYSGDLNRPGCYATRQLVDEQLVALKPKTLSFADAAAFPLTSLTAYEMLFEKIGLIGSDRRTVLIIGGAGGVGSQAIQLLKLKTSMTIIATASRSESQQWVAGLGADHVVSHQNFVSEIRALGIQFVDFVFSTTHSGQHWSNMAEIIAPFGEIGLIDDADGLDISIFKRKAVSLHWELMFTKSMFGYRMESQGKILSEVKNLIESGRMRTTANRVLNGLTVENLRAGHTMLEQHTNVGKMVVLLSSNGQ